MEQHKVLVKQQKKRRTFGISKQQSNKRSTELERSSNDTKAASNVEKEEAGE
jgi:hypothetical protein